MSIEKELKEDIKAFERNEKEQIKRFQKLQTAFTRLENQLDVMYTQAKFALVKGKDDIGLDFSKERFLADMQFSSQNSEKAFFQLYHDTKKKLGTADNHLYRAQLRVENAKADLQDFYKKQPELTQKPTSSTNIFKKLFSAQHARPSVLLEKAKENLKSQKESLPQNQNNNSNANIDPPQPIVAKKTSFEPRPPTTPSPRKR